MILIARIRRVDGGFHARAVPTGPPLSGLTVSKSVSNARPVEVRHPAADRSACGPVMSPGWVEVHGIVPRARADTSAGCGLGGMVTCAKKSVGLGVTVITGRSGNEGACWRGGIARAALKRNPVPFPAPRARPASRRSIEPRPWLLGSGRAPAQRHSRCTPEVVKGGRRSSEDM